MNWSNLIRYDLIRSGVIILHQINFNLFFFHFFSSAPSPIHSSKYSIPFAKRQVNVFRFNFNIWYVVNVYFPLLNDNDGIKIFSWFILRNMWCLFQRMSTKRSNNTFHGKYTQLNWLNMQLQGTNSMLHSFALFTKRNIENRTVFCFYDYVTTLKSHINVLIKPDQTRQQ